MIISAIKNILSLTHWGRVTHIYVGKLTIIGSDNGFSPERRQAIIWPNAGILLIGPLGTNFSEILIKIQTFSLNKMPLKMSSAKCCSFRFGLNVLITTCIHCAVRHNLVPADTYQGLYIYEHTVHNTDKVSTFVKKQSHQFLKCWWRVV